MVNHGVSRGCAACKRRHKKCDEMRPSCTRCLRARRVCPGYMADTSLIFHNYGSQDIIIESPSPMPPYSSDMDDVQLSDLASDIFITDFVVQSENPRFSRGFLDGMQNIMPKLSPESTLSRASKLVALASVGNRFNRPGLLMGADSQYGALLQKYHSLLSADANIQTIECLYTAVLLGIYEIIASNKKRAMEHTAHVRGVCAILSSGISPIDLRMGVSVFQVGNSLLLKNTLPSPAHGVLVAPVSHGIVHDLDTTLIKFGSLFYRCEDFLSEIAPDPKELSQLYFDSTALDSEFDIFRRSVRDTWGPTTVGHVSNDICYQSPPKFYRPGPIDDYMDLYVASVWNTYRKSHIMLLDLMQRLGARLRPDEEQRDTSAKASELVNQFLYSIPYHLTRNLSEYQRIVETEKTAAICINRPVGGLLLMHPLYAVASCPIVPSATRTYLADCLSWIGREMGVGQAAILADAIWGSENRIGDILGPKLPFQTMSEGHILIWGGMLLQPL